MRKLITVFIIFTLFWILYYIFWYKIWCCLPYDNRCFILNLEEVWTKMIIDWDKLLYDRYKTREDNIFNALENWDYNRAPSVTLMLANILNKNRLENFKEQVISSKNNRYWEYLISSVLISSWENAKKYIIKYPYILNYKDSKSSQIRNWFVYFIRWIDKVEANNILNEMSKNEKDTLIKDNIKKIKEALLK